VALIDWSATQGGERLEAKEGAVYCGRSGKVVKASFYQDNSDADREVWE